MRDEAKDPLSALSSVVDGMAQFASDPELIWLFEAGKMQGRMSGLARILEELEDIRQRARLGEALEGDTFRAIRLLLRFRKSDLIRTVMELGLPDDEEAILPWRADLKRRKPSRHEKLTAEIRGKVGNRFEKQRKQDDIVRRVTLVRFNERCSLPKALEIVAAGTDLSHSGLLSEYLRPVVRSVAAVRSDFMAGMKRHRKKGYVEYKANALIGGGYRRLYFGDLTKKGRRPHDNR